MKIASVFGFVVFTLFISLSPLNAKQIHREKSLYRNVIIVEENGRRCMRFETRRKWTSNQACIDLSDKQKLVFEYARGVMAGFLHNPKPKRVLIIGLGGGMLQQAIHQLSKDTEIVSVEIDPVVVKLAQKYFGYGESNQLKTVVKDGRVYVKRAILKKETFDWIILDAFNGDYIPEHLMTQQFLQEVKQLLASDGLLMANTFSNSRLYDYESVTYQSVFSDLLIYQTPTKGNRVIMACNCEHFTMPEHADPSWQQKLQPFSVNLSAIMARITDEISWDTRVRPLTDEYSPANLLKQQD